MPTNNTASLKRTDPAVIAGLPSASPILPSLLPGAGRASAKIPDAILRNMLVLRGLIAIALMTSVWVSFHPFLSAQKGAGGDIVNQLGFGAVMLLCLGTLAGLVNRRLVARLAQPAYLLMALVLIFSVMTAANMADAFRAMMFSVIVVVAALAVLVLPRHPGQLAVFLGAGCLVALAYSGFALIAYPAEAIHQPGGFEAQHAGLWRGVYDHKNVAGAVWAVFAMIGIFVWREKHALLGFLVTALSLWFLLNTGSRTSLIVLPVSMLYAAFVSRIRTPLLRFSLTLIPLAMLFSITVGSAAFDEINGALQALAPGTTFTGRLDLWQYTIERIGERPFLGYGFESFWGTPLVTNADQPIELSWDVREIVHGHNSYLDAIITFGLPGFLIVFYVLIIRPVADYAAIQWQGASSRMANLFLAIWMFTSLDACLESFFFRRADPVWFCMLIAVFGLRLLATGLPHRRRVTEVAH